METNSLGSVSLTMTSMYSFSDHPKMLGPEMYPLVIVISDLLFLSFLDL